MGETFGKMFEWLVNNLETVKEIMRSNAGIIFITAFILTAIIPILIGFIYKTSLFRIRRILGEDFELDINTVLGSMLIPLIILFVIPMNFEDFMISNIALTVTIFSVLTFTGGCCLGSFANYLYLMSNSVGTSLVNDEDKNFNGFRRFIGITAFYINKCIKEISKIFKISFKQYITNVKSWDLYVIYHAYINRYSIDDLDKVKVSKLMIVLISIYSISLLTVIAFNTYAFLKLLV